jgi:hypothetical protein
MGDTAIETRPANPQAIEWAERIAAQQRSGRSVKQFCKENALTEYSFYAWRKRLQESGPVRFALVERRSPRRQERTTEPALELVSATGERLRMQAVRRRAVRLVPGCALAHPGALHYPAKRTPPAKMGTRPYVIIALSRSP